jgi:hypothetical protein
MLEGFQGTVPDCSISTWYQSIPLSHRPIILRVIWNHAGKLEGASEGRAAAGVVIIASIRCHDWRGRTGGSCVQVSAVV